MCSTARLKAVVGYWLGWFDRCGAALQFQRRQPPFRKLSIH
jgi:hypothetical protein